jgi:hypothetical protein
LTFVRGIGITYSIKKAVRKHSLAQSSFVLIKAIRVASLDNQINNSVGDLSRVATDYSGILQNEADREDGPQDEHDIERHINVPRLLLHGHLEFDHSLGEFIFLEPHLVHGVL